MPLFPELARAKGSVGCCWPSPEGYKWLTAVYRAPASPADFSGPNNFLSSLSTEDELSSVEPIVNSASFLHIFKN